ncbi:MAG: hypothetical protein HF978_06560 [Desulfobacteraceae bacterium]|nr:hypothetical protein [Desulfobacteraceae bacterium]MBC2755193.1 hypothetical protein [Desulfobacteraceae bacterium]
MDIAYDKIRILWIDDCEGQDAGYMYPEKKLPDELAKYFQIVNHSAIPGPSSIRTSSDFGTCFGPFWWGSGDTSKFPPEIIAMDYNLRKWTDTHGKVNDERNNESTDPLSVSQSNKSKFVVTSDPSKKDVGMKAGFEGLVMGIFISSLLYQHPIGIVPMTNYGNLLEDVSEVRTLHLISKEILNIDYSEFGVSGEDRSWTNVIKKGVQALRARIENLYETFQITLSPSDLMALTESADHGVLTMHSPHAERKFSINGLFIDIPEENRAEAIQKWARDLLQTVMVDCDELKQAQELCGTVWNAYDNDELVKDRKNLSLLTIIKEAGDNYDKDAYKDLTQKFGVSGKKCKQGCVDIKTGAYSDRVRRWATFLVTLNLLKRVIQIKKRVEEHVRKTTIEVIDNSESPVMTVDDLYLALFPAPSSPLVIPWHEGKGIDKSFNWVTTMRRWKDKKEVGKKTGDLALSLPDMLAGESWNPEGPHGLTPSEQLILRGFALEDKELSQKDWDSYNTARLIFRGKK